MVVATNANPKRNWNFFSIQRSSHAIKINAFWGYVLFAHWTWTGEEKMSKLVVGDNGSAKTSFFSFGILGGEATTMHSLQFQFSFSIFDSITAKRTFLPHTHTLSWSRRNFISLIAPSLSCTHTNSIYKNQSFSFGDAHCSAQSIRIRDIRRMEQHCILSRIAHGTHFIVRYDCQCLHNIAVAQMTRLSTMIAIYLHRKLIIHIANEAIPFYGQRENTKTIAGVRVSRK